MSVEPLMCQVTQVSSRQCMSSDTRSKKIVDVEWYKCQVTVERLVYAKHQRLKILSDIVLTYLFVIEQTTM